MQWLWGHWMFDRSEDRRKPLFEKGNLQGGERQGPISERNWIWGEVMCTLAPLRVKCGILGRLEQRHEVIYVFKRSSVIYVYWTGLASNAKSLVLSILV